MQPAPTRLAQATHSDLADALDLGAIGIAEAIAFDFGSTPASPPTRPARPAAWRRWLGTAVTAAGLVDRPRRTAVASRSVALGLSGRLPRAAH